MKTLKISEETHNKLTLFKNIHKNKSFDETIKDLINGCVEYEYEYSDLTVDQYKLLSDDK